MCMFFLRLLSIALLLQSTLAQSGSLSLKLIHRDSVESPLYPGKLSSEERSSRYVNQTIAHAHRQIQIARGNQNELIHPNEISIPVDFHGFYFIVIVGIGTIDGQYQNYYFILDTGSNLVWLQCEGCKNCFPQRSPLFGHATSTTYHPLRCDVEPLNPLCTPGECWEDTSLCSYKVRYADAEGPLTEGVLASEKFTFNNAGGTESINGIVFGCGLNNIKFDTQFIPNNEIAGIMGMGSGPRSFISQLGDRFQHRFSYCLQPMNGNQGINTYLRFGEDAKINPQGRVVKATPILGGPAVGKYYLNLLSISIADQRISNPPLTLWRTLIDSGSPYSLFPPGPFASVKSYLLSYLQPYNVKTIRSRDQLDLCFDRPNGFNKFPSITFHFRNADLVLGPENSFEIKDDYFCLAMVYFEDLTDILIGTYQQANFRFLYDLHGSILSFSPEDCSNDS
ncbi:aspartic proteinase CDR1-like [Macadamia integrifolia]|uniref:aspartic proteinase CDR1-like n=1 Tax=Macadamia integrifolia TaxID=60698 RepID=UPI001C4FBCB5|nr:aspartic proteinase CDR1-like [Macadamia integrifolia]